MPTIDSSGIRLVYDDAGRGEPALLLLPGWCANRTVFAELLPYCSRRRRVLALDWRGHGESGAFADDFGEAELTADALAVIAASGARQVVPVALSHAGWVAIELRRRLGERIPRLALLDWLILDAPPPFLEALQGMQSPARWRATVERLCTGWLEGVDQVEVTRFVRQEMGAYGFDMWARAARSIQAAYARAGSPLAALARLAPPAPVVHLYAQPTDPAYLAAQRAFAAAHPWFRVQRLPARSHFPTLEIPAALAAAIEAALV